MTAVWIVAAVAAIPVGAFLSAGLLDARQYRWRRR